MLSGSLFPRVCVAEMKIANAALLTTMLPICVRRLANQCAIITAQSYIREQG